MHCYCMYHINVSGWSDLLNLICILLLAGHGGQRSDEEEEGEVEEEVEVVKKSSEVKDSDGEVEKAEKQEADGQV